MCWRSEGLAATSPGFRTAPFGGDAPARPVRSSTDEVLHATDAEAIAAVQADVVIESSGNHHGLASAIQGAARGGTVVMVGLLPTGPQPVLISLAITRELDLKGSFRFNDEIDEVITALAEGTLTIGPVITHDYPVTDALNAFDTARNSAQSGKVLLNFAGL
jgi:L-iditol 2-dehydrogenase/L-idonate 5-dehydrogenase